MAAVEYLLGSFDVVLFLVDIGGSLQPPRSSTTSWWCSRSAVRFLTPNDKAREENFKWYDVQMAERTVLGGCAFIYFWWLAASRCDGIWYLNVRHWPGSDWNRTATGVRSQYIERQALEDSIYKHTPLVCIDGSANFLSGTRCLVIFRMNDSCSCRLHTHCGSATLSHLTSWHCELYCRS